MELLIVFLLFILCMTAALITGLSMIFPLVIGFFLFSFLAMRKGFSIRQIASFAAGSFKDSFIVVSVMLIIGCLIGLWRQSGTIAYFISLGVSLIPPWGFLPASFLLTAVMSYAIGTSFGVTATAGVILISIARASGVSPVLTAGAILSGVYIGDRGSPASSSANLVAVLTHTDMRKNIRMMLRSAALPFLCCAVLYAALSFALPLMEPSGTVTDLLRAEFAMHWTCLIPAILMLALPFTGIRVRTAMLISIISAFLIAVFVQGAAVLDCFKCMLLGYKAADPQLDAMISGGGILSMLEVSVILLISGTYGGIFRGTGMLEAFNKRLVRLSGRIGRYPAMLLLSMCTCALFCNQTIGAIMQNQLSASLFGDTEPEKEDKMIAMENSVILVAGLVPWCIASSVPLSMLGANAASLPFAFFLWLLPLFTVIRQKKLFHRP